MEEKQLLQELTEIKNKYGEWAYDIPLNENVWTKGNMKVPHTRLKRIVQVAGDLLDKPLSKCRVLDLGCLDGIFSVEFAMTGAETVGIEVREDNIEKAQFCKKALNLTNLSFIKDDARNISVESYGMFDVIICSGLLYHLTAPDAIKLISKMYEMTNRLLIIDTHIAISPKVPHTTESNEYWGKLFKEHDAIDTQKVKSKRLWSSWDNEFSFWFTRPSLVNLLNHTGFSSVYECFNPSHIKLGEKGPVFLDRCTFVAIKSEKVELKTSPAANSINEDWPEESLNYSANEGGKKIKKMLSKIKKAIFN